MEIPRFEPGHPTSRPRVPAAAHVQDRLVAGTGSILTDAAAARPLRHGPGGARGGAA
ncbi:hypothetical protein ACH41H_24710 [Streptomyces sp. NPDC020800]|uniref:hypothetical protein n=1 Tax=Streptomyces sp. NPDC020800 TaxID=3365092 RepID=UPI0037B3B1E8